MTDDSPLDMSDDDLVDLLSAWLDDELEAPTRDRVDEILSSTPRARDLLASLTAGRDAMRRFARADESSPTQLEVARLDRAVLGTTRDRLPHRASPSKRGRSPAPYFAVAAVIAIALMTGIVVLTRSMSQQTADSVAGTAVDERPEEEAVGAPEMSGEGGSATDMSASGFFVSGIAAAGQEDLTQLLAAQTFAATSDAAGAPASTDPASSPEEGLLRAAAGLDGFEDLASCLDAAEASIVPRRVDTGTWQGAEVYFVSGVDAAGAPAVVVVARPDCTALLTVR
ncbi:MAG: hypothetical protein IT198_14060 [Acidimicrobiia bacterium]|nr:hypothetical protein [Acidimicrobiia bacterium]